MLVVLSTHRSVNIPRPTVSRLVGRRALPATFLAHRGNILPFPKKLKSLVFSPPNPNSQIHPPVRSTVLAPLPRLSLSPRLSTVLVPLRALAGLFPASPPRSRHALKLWPTPSCRPPGAEDLLAARIAVSGRRRRYPCGEHEPATLAPIRWQAVRSGLCHSQVVSVDSCSPKAARSPLSPSLPPSLLVWYSCSSSLCVAVWRPPALSHV